MEKKVILQKAIQEIDAIQLLVKDCMVFFEFIEEFYVFSMKLLGSDVEENSIRQMLHRLKVVEKKLIKLGGVEERFLNAELGGIDYFAYQASLESYCENFFLEFSFGEGLYDSVVLLAKKIRTCFIEYYPHIAQANFNLEQIILFFRKNISAAPPAAEHCLVGLSSSFLYTIFFEFIKSQPINSNLTKLQTFVRFHTTILKFPAAENVLYKFIELQEKLTKLGSVVN